jgi:hypothetical protein
MLFRTGPLEIRMEVAENRWSNFLHKYILQKTPPGYIRRPGDIFLPLLGDNQVAGCQETNPLHKANATASDRLATPNLERIWLTCVLMVDGLTTNLTAIRIGLEGLIFNPPPVPGSLPSE